MGLISAPSSTTPCLTTGVLLFSLDFQEAQFSIGTSEKVIDAGISALCIDITNINGSVDQSLLLVAGRASILLA